MRTKKIKPNLLKWPGGKSRQAPTIARMIGRVRGLYSEPFCGSLAVYFELAKNGQIDRALLADANAPLIAFWQRVKKDPSGLSFDLRRLPVDNKPEAYYEVRAEFNRSHDPAALLWLNKAGFNGLYRVNLKGGYNVPKGTYRERLPLPSLEDIEEASRLLQPAQLHCCGFSAHSFDADSTYCDPPYVPLPGKNSFVAYTREGFGMDDHRRLAELAERSPGRVVISNSEPARELYPAPVWEIRTIDELRSIGAKANTRRKVTEILAVCESEDVPR